MIHSYSTSTFELLFSYHGHDGRITNVVWHPDDSRIVSSGLVGAVYEWDVVMGKRGTENVIKGCGYKVVAISHDGKLLYTVSNNRNLKEIVDSQVLSSVPVMSNRQIIRSIDSKEIISAICVSPGGRSMFAGTTRGTLRSVKYPFNPPIIWHGFYGHGANITKYRMT